MWCLLAKCPLVIQWVQINFEFWHFGIHTIMFLLKFRSVLPDRLSLNWLLLGWNLLKIRLSKNYGLQILIFWRNLHSLNLEFALWHYHFDCGLRNFRFQAAAGPCGHGYTLSLISDGQAVCPDCRSARFGLCHLYWTLWLGQFQNFFNFAVLFESFNVFKINFWIDCLKSVNLHIFLKSKVSLYSDGGGLYSWFSSYLRKPISHRIHKWVWINHRTWAH